MKTRNGFVSNSSSTSFICSVCDYHGEYGSEGEQGAKNCSKCNEYYHEECYEQFTPQHSFSTLDEKFEFIKDKIKECYGDGEEVEEFSLDYSNCKNDDERGNILYSIRQYLLEEDTYCELEFCPVCTHKVVPRKKLKAFLLKKCGMSDKTAAEEYYEYYPNGEK